MDPRLVALIAVMATIIVVLLYIVFVQGARIERKEDKLNLSLAILREHDGLHEEFKRRLALLHGVNPKMVPPINPMLVPEASIDGTGGPSNVVVDPAPPSPRADLGYAPWAGMQRRK